MKRLVIASLNYSSWSVRAWLALRHAGIAFRTHEIGLFVDPEWKAKILQFSGAGKVPVLIDGSLSIHEALAIGEYAAELTPGARLWPEDLALRARARAVCCEMATSFSSLRQEMSMNARTRVKLRQISGATQADIERIQDIWWASLQSSGGPYLFGHFTLADAMYLPVLSRFRTYGVELKAELLAYEQTLWATPVVCEWWELAQVAAAIPKHDELLKSLEAQ